MAQPTEQERENDLPSREVLIALGSNLPSDIGSPVAAVRSAAAALAARHASARLSPLYRTPAFPPGSGPDYVNAAMTLRSARPAADLLADLHAIEAEAGRTRSLRWGARVLDLDLLACGDEVLPDAATFVRWRDLPLARQQVDSPDRLILPHPRMQDRGFVLRPLADLSPDWRHPVIGATVAGMLAALPPDALEGVVPLPG